MTLPARFAVYRPTSRDAIAKMLSGIAVGSADGWCPTAKPNVFFLDGSRGFPRGCGSFLVLVLFRWLETFGGLKECSQLVGKTIHRSSRVLSHDWTMNQFVARGTGAQMFVDTVL